MDISIRIRTHFESDSREQWELGQELFQKDPKGLSFWLDVQQAIRKQAQRMGVPARKLQTHDIVLKMEHLVADLQSLEIRVSKDGTKKIPTFVAFMRSFQPKDDSTWDIWKYVLEGRIKPALVRGSEDPSGGRGTSLDLENNPPTVPATDPIDLPKLARAAWLSEVLKELSPKDQAILLMTMWSLLNQAEKDIYRPVIIQTGSELCYKQEKSKKEFPTLDHWIARNTNLFRLNEAYLNSAISNEQIRAVELQESISLHYHGAVSAEQSKSEFAERFLSHGGVRQLLPVSNDSEDGSVSFAVNPLTPSWQSDAKALLLKICQQAVMSESKDKFHEQFCEKFPLTDIYKDYESKQGPPKRQNNALWMLMRFGDNCQCQSYHLDAYRSQESEFSKMQATIGFEDQTIGEILGMEPGAVAVRRFRYRARLKEKLGLPTNQVPDPSSDKDVQPTIDVVCSDYEA